jgi:hypothetical protein
MNKAAGVCDVGSATVYGFIVEGYQVPMILTPRFHDYLKRAGNYCQRNQLQYL